MLKKQMKKIIKNIPWYFGRKFWIILSGMLGLISISVFQLAELPDGILLKIGFYFEIFPNALSFVIGNYLYKAIGFWFVFIYWLILLILFYQGFKNKKVKIIPLAIAIVIVLASCFGIVLTSSMAENIMRI